MKKTYLLFLSTAALCYFILAFFLTTELSIDKKTYHAEKGFLDLSQWQFEKPISLSGQWEFYPNKLLLPADFLSQKFSAESSYLKVPGPWNSAMNEQGYGVGTYRLRIKLSPDTYMLGIKSEVIRSAHKLYINGELLHTDGMVGLSASEHQMRNIPEATYFKQKGGTLDILIQASNFDRDMGGITQNLILGNQVQITKLQLVNYGLDFSGVLLLIIFGFYQIWLYFTVKPIKGFIYSGLLPIFAGITTAFRNQKIMGIFVQSYSMEWFYRCQFISAAIAVTFMALLIYEMGRTSAQKRIMQVYIGLSILYSTYVMIVPYRLHSKYEIAYWLVIIGLNIVMVIESVRYGLKYKWLHQEKKIMLTLVLGVSFAILGQFDAILYYFGMRSNMVLNYLSSLIFIFVLTTFYKQQYQLSELRIAEAEQELLKSEIAFLQAQIEPHFVFNALNTVVSFCYVEPLKAASLLRDLSKYLRFTFDSERFHRQATIEMELEATHAYINIEKARFGDRLEVKFNCEKELLNAEVPFLLLQPLVENAIKHGVMKRERGGEVEVMIGHIGKQLYISVSDNGVGMTVDPTFEAYGVGLKNIKKRIDMIQGAGIHIDSYLDKKTEVQLYLPLQMK